MITTHGKLQGGSGKFSGFSVAAIFTARMPVGGDGPKLTATENRSAEVREPTTASGAFRITIPNVRIVGGVRFRVYHPNGAVAVEKVVEVLGKSITIDVPPVKVPVVTANHDPDTGKHVKLMGAVVDAAARVRPSGAEVRISAVPLAGGVERTVLTATTDAHGNFSGEYPRGKWKESFAEVAVAPGIRVPVALEADHTLPRRVLVAVAVQTTPEVKPADRDCPGAVTVPRQPAAEELIDAAETYSADKGGRCVSFTVPNRTIEEYLYTLIVRTTDPQIKGLVLEEPESKYVPGHVIDDIREHRRPFRDPAASKESLAPAPDKRVGKAATPVAPASVARTPRMRLDVFRSLGPRPTPEAIAAAVDESVVADALEQANAASHILPGRALLGPDNPIDWDAEPTFYQATTIALGHLVYFKQVWKADGFSLGDLLYSLPLAPAQKKQIAVVDWERRETATRSEELLATEELAADLSRDRDILEIVNTTVDETMKGASAALTGGVAKSKGSSEGGRVMGVAGGGGGAASGAIQDSNRTLAVSALQQLHDRTAQVAGAMRSQRATVVQSVTQGETMRVETDTVANYNHCHAMTMEYFEVLRHFRVEHEVAGVSECLFVPLMMSPFTEPKALRWRTALEPRLLDRRLAPGFPAVDRIRHAYEGSDLPLHRYADENIEGLEGELTMEFSWVRPADDEHDEPQREAWRFLEPFLLAKGGLTAVFVVLRRLGAKERDRVFRDEIVPSVIEEFVDKLRIRVGGLGVGGVSKDANLDVTLLSRPRAGVPLRASLRPRGAAPRITRAEIATVTISAPDMLPNDTEARALVRTGSLRYRTAHRQDFLFHNYRIDNDLTREDAVRIDTPLNRQEQRNPRDEDKEASRHLVAHLNENLEYYHRALWLGMDAGRRYMLLDGVLVPGLGRSVAAVVENRLIAVVGNSLVMPVAPGFRLDSSSAPLLNLYAPTVPFPPVRLSLPTRGVFAEAVMGECNSCEKIDDTRFWRWEESPIPGEAPVISPVSADSRATASPDLAAKDFASPIINLQNAPSAPDPTGLGAALSVIGASNLFRDVTGLEGNQKNAAAALAGALAGAGAASEAATKAVERAADLQSQKQLARDSDRIIDKIETAHAAGSIDSAQRRQLIANHLDRVSDPSGRATSAQPPSVDDLGKFSGHLSRLGKGGELKANLETGEFEGKTGDVSQLGPIVPGAAPTAPSPNELKLRDELTTKLKGDPDLQLLLDRVDVLKGKHDRAEYLALALDAVSKGLVAQLLSAPEEIVNRDFPAGGSERQGKALSEALETLRISHLELSIDGSPSPRIPLDRVSFNFQVQPPSVDSLVDVPGVGELLVRTVALGATVPEPPRPPPAFPIGLPVPEAFRVVVEEMQIDSRRLLNLIWSLAVAIKPALDEKFGGAPAVSRPVDLFNQRIDINPGSDIYKSFGLSRALQLTAFPSGGKVLLGMVPTMAMRSDPPGNGSKVSGNALVAFVGSSTFYETATSDGEFFGAAISDILAQTRTESPSLGLVVRRLEALDHERKSTLHNSEQGGVVLGNFEALSKIKSEDVSVTIFVCDFPVPEFDDLGLSPDQLARINLEAQVASAQRDRFKDMWRIGAGIKSALEILPPTIRGHDMKENLAQRIDSLKEGQLFVFNYFGHTFEGDGTGRLLGMQFTDGSFFNPQDLREIADYAGNRKVHFFAVMETCQSGGYLNALAKGQIEQLKESGKPTQRLASIFRVQTGLEDIYDGLWRLISSFELPVKTQYAEWAMQGLAATTDADVPPLPVIDFSLALPFQDNAQTNDTRVQMESAVKDIRANRTALKSVAGELRILLDEIFASPLLQGAIVMPIEHGRNGTADEVVGPVADKLTEAFQIELKALRAVFTPEVSTLEMGEWKKNPWCAGEAALNAGDLLTADFRPRSQTAWTPLVQRLTRLLLFIDVPLHVVTRGTEAAVRQ